MRFFDGVKCAETREWEHIQRRIDAIKLEIHFRISSTVFCRNGLDLFSFQWL